MFSKRTECVCTSELRKLPPIPIPTIPIGCHCFQPFPQVGSGQASHEESRCFSCSLWWASAASLSARPEGVEVLGILSIAGRRLIIQFSDIFSTCSLDTNIQNKLQTPGKTQSIFTIVDVVHHKALWKCHKASRPCPPRRVRIWAWVSWKAASHRPESGKNGKKM